MNNLQDSEIMLNFATQKRGEPLKKQTNRSISVAVSTPPSHGGDSGSSPGSTTKDYQTIVLFYCISVGYGSIWDQRIFPVGGEDMDQRILSDIMVLNDSVYNL